MNSILNVEKDTDKVISKFSSLLEHCDSCLTDLISEIETLQFDLSQSNAPNDVLPTTNSFSMLNHVIKKVQDVSSQLAKEHRDFHSTVSRVGKAIDKNFNSDYGAMENRLLWSDDESKTILNRVIIEHFMRKGMLDIVDSLVTDAGLEMLEEEKKPFTELNQILISLRKRDLKPALDWVEINREKLIQQNSSLEFKLHRLQFIEYLCKGVEKQSELIAFARTKLQPLVDRHAKEIQALMGSLLYLKTGLENSPYAYLLDILNWSEICDVFIRDSCCLMGMSVDSPLNIAFEAGTVAFPALLNIRQMMSQRRVASVWTAKDELPIVIDLDKKFQFHSIFACPILRQQASDVNPPMRLDCGHVISRDALTKMSNGSTKVKCPYCPVEQNPQIAKQIFF
ncbi:E3 ubiquitin-protein ligase RMND5A-like [Panonychus citri]|uniref:E3 ubiquitin-protein ligase RMND5A-like n=1 Tax=Panonychus citri TaxID=50023 RepID=UPI00230736B8|nr:E3 ubiquitin-protein ligase RMND5A-like [Panonychus citri]